MLLPRLISVVPAEVRLMALASVILFGIVPTALRAQDTPSAPSSQAAPPSAPQPAQPQAVHLKDYSKPRPAFPHLLQPYKAQELPQPNLGNSPRIDSLMRDGKIYLSIDDAVALALENNLDLDIARYNLNIADADLLRAKSGASILGVNTGIVQNTPGGGVGGLGGTVGSGTGGTTVAAGGAGTGTNGLVSSTLGIGSPITSFDPQLTGTLQLDKNDTESVSVLSPVPILAQNTYTAELRLHAGLSVGHHTYGRLQQHSRHHQQPHQPADSATRFELPVPSHAESVAGLRIPPQHAIHSHCQEQPRDFRRCLPPANHHDRRPDRKHVLGPGLRLRKCARAAGIADLRAEGPRRQQAPGAGRHRAPNSGGKRAEHRRHRPAESDRRAEQSATAATAHEERAQPQHRRSGAGGGRRDSHLDHAAAGAGAGRFPCRT